MPRLYRQAPLNDIWEGSGNVQCLDVLRAVVRFPPSVDALLDELDATVGEHADLDAAIVEVHEGLRAPSEPRLVA